MTGIATSSLVLLLLIGSSVVGALYFFGVFGPLLRGRTDADSDVAERTAELLEEYRRHHEDDAVETY